MADLRKRITNNKATDVDTETENEGANQDSDTVRSIYGVIIYKILL